MKKLFLLLALAMVIGCISDSPDDSPAASFSANSSELSSQILLLTEEKADLQKQLIEMNTTLKHYKTELLSYQEKFRKAEKELCEVNFSNFTAFEGEAHMEGPAVRQRIEEEGNFPFVTRKVIREGEMLDISVEVTPGRGRVLVVTEPLMGTIFQDAANTAVLVAENKTNQSLSESDVIFSVNGSQVMSVDGPSAGALMTSILISTLNEAELNNSVTMTGTIKQNGSIGPIAGVVEKAFAAEEAGKKLFLLPKENSELIRWEEKRKTYGLVTYLTQVPTKVDAKAYIEKEVGISVEYVANIDEAIEYLKE